MSFQWGPYGPKAGPQGPANNKVYVAADIVNYCMASKLDLASYCKSIEPALVTHNSTFVTYNPSDPYHMEDILNNGCPLVSTGLMNYEQIKGLAARGTEKQVERGLLSPPGALPRNVEFLKLDNDDSKQKTLSLLGSVGIGYEKGGSGDDPDGLTFYTPPPPKPQRPSLASRLAALLGADNDEEPD